MSGRRRRAANESQKPHLPIPRSTARPGPPRAEKGPVCSPRPPRCEHAYPQHVCGARTTYPGDVGLEDGIPSALARWRGESAAVLGLPRAPRRVRVHRPEGRGGREGHKGCTYNEGAHGRESVREWGPLPRPVALTSSHPSRDRAVSLTVSHLHTPTGGRRFARPRGQRASFIRRLAWRGLLCELRLLGRASRRVPSRKPPAA